MPAKTSTGSTDRDDFVDYLVDALAELGPIEAKRFFSGKGLKLDQVLIGFVIRGTFWLRVDEAGRAAMIATGSVPFSYQRQGRQIELTGYYAVPASMLEDTDELIDWVRRAYHVAAIDRETKPSRSKRGGDKVPAPRRR
jgi:DNA transformation protein